MKLRKFLILGLLFIVACNVETDENGVIPSYSSILEFFTFEPNTTFITRTVPDAMFELEEEIFTTFVSENRFQQRIRSIGGLENTAVLEYSDGVLRQVFSELYFYTHEDATNSEPNTEFVILVEPLSLGTVWQTADGITAEITAIDREIETPFATFTETIEVTTSFPNGDYSVTIFAKGYGRVWDSYTISDDDTITSLTTHLVNVIQGPMQSEIVIFEGENPVDIIEILVETNQNFEELLSEILNVNINQIEVTRGEEIATVHVDFAEEPTSMSIESLSNIFSRFYMAEFFLSTINGMPHVE